eukprot:GHUV01022845.1.p1 GENE.GHUV01022845.1~~GHUV01022845.1.p1  ORF type:complete len:235 (+),score=77.46 GHUV01022845.1:1186-1890(+)
MAGTSSTVRCKSPGRAHCQLNYPREEHVVEVNVLDKVKQAKEDVLQHYKADIMGVRGPQWINSSFVPNAKYTQAAADEHLPNQLTASNFQPADLRHTKTCNQQYDKQKDHPFTRGDCTTGWNHSTEVTKIDKRVWLQQLDSKAGAATVQRKQEVKRYVSPQKREEQFAGTLRNTKELAAAQKDDFEQQYGPEGAAAMKQILAMKVPERRPVQIKATKDDLAAVDSLPGLGLADP